MARFIMAQLCATDDYRKNLQKAEKTADNVKGYLKGDMVIFPEYFMYYQKAGTSKAEIAANSQPLDGPFADGMRQLAKEYGLWMCFGMNEQFTAEKSYNTTVLVSDQGEIIATYRKTHLYDAFHYRESDYYEPGDTLFTPVATPFGTIGMIVCYDMRFPETARIQALRGAEIILAPSAFVRGRNKVVHWESLVRTRAIENGVFVIAANHISPKVFMGHSLAVSPDGVVLTSGGYEEAILPVDVDLSEIQRVREQNPMLENRREALYQERI